MDPWLLASELEELSLSVGSHKVVGQTQIGEQVLSSVHHNNTMEQVYEYTHDINKIKPLWFSEVIFLSSPEKKCVKYSIYG